MAASSSTMASAFPKFADGDVHIVVSGTRQFKLHSTLLRDSSGLFRELLKESHAAKLSKKAVNRGVTARFRLVLQNQTINDAGSDQVEFIRHDLNESGIPKNPTNTIPLDLENGMPPNLTHVAYGAVLGAFYNIPIDFGDFKNDDASGVLNIAIRLAKVAETLQCMHVVNKPIEAALLSQRQLIFRAIAKQPIQWLQYGALIKSIAIFREALILAAGMYNSPDVQTCLHLLRDAPEIEGIVEKKATELKENVRAAFVACSQYYPETIQRAPGQSNGRESYSGDVFVWMTMTLMRHWLTQQISSDETHNAEDMGYTVLNWIIKGGDAYVADADRFLFHGLFPMSDKGRNLMTALVTEFKAKYRSIVTPLWSNESSLDVVAFDFRYLVCTQVDNKKDIPWLRRMTDDSEMNDDATDDEEDDAGDDDSEE